MALLYFSPIIEFMIRNKNKYKDLNGEFRLILPSYSEFNGNSLPRYH